MAKVEIIGLDKVLRNFNNIAKNMANPTKAMTIIAAKSHKGVIDNFSREQSPKGKWASTKRGGRILQDKGTLRNSIRFMGKRFQAIVSTSLIYARTHNLGDPKRNIKQRKFLWLSKGKISAISKFFLRFIVKG
jgi:phage gpG-like protein